MKKSWTKLVPETEPITDERGYVLVVCKQHPHPKSNNGHVYLHRLIMENHLGRFLDSKDCVHHINKNRSDNRLRNLKVMDNADHSRKHEKETPESYKKKRTERFRLCGLARRKPRIMIKCACGCKKTLENLDSQERERKFIHGHNGRKAPNAFWAERN